MIVPDRMATSTRSVVLLLAIAMPGVPVAAQDDSAFEVTARIEPDTGVTDTEPIELVIRVSGAAGANLTTPRLPPMDNLRVIQGPNTASSFENRNGRVSLVATFRYTLLAERPGRAEVPTIEVRVGDRTYRTEPISFDVVSGSRTPPRAGRPSQDESVGGRAGDGEAPEVYLRANVSRDEIWAGQPVLFEVDLLDGVGVADMSWIDAPSFSNFWVEDDLVQPRAESSRVTIGGRPFRVWPLVRKILIPTRPGEFRIEPYSVRVVLPNRGGWDPLRDPFQLRRPTAIRKSEPVTIRVRELPETGRPDTFTGAVGSFELRTEVDRDEASVDDAVALRAVVSGQGFLKPASAPELPPTPQVRVFDPKVEDRTVVRREGLQSSKAWEWVLVPLSAGEISVPEVSFTFFDPDAATYRTIRSDPLRLTVTGSSGTSGTGAGRGALRPERLDIRYAKPRFSPLRPTTPPAHATLAFQVLLWSPLVAVPALIIVGRWRIRQRADRGRVRSRGARARARRRLRRTERHSRSLDDAAFHEEIARALVDYVADRFDRSATGLTYDVADTLLAGRSVPQAVRRDFRSCLEACDFARYVPVSGGGEQRRELLDRVRSVLDRLESSM